MQVSPHVEGYQRRGTLVRNLSICESFILSDLQTVRPFGAEHFTPQGTQKGLKVTQNPNTVWETHTAKKDIVTLIGNPRSRVSIWAGRHGKKLNMRVVIVPRCPAIIAKNEVRNFSCFKCKVKLIGIIVKPESQLDPDTIAQVAQWAIVTHIGHAGTETKHKPGPQFIYRCDRRFQRAFRYAVGTQR
jgi:hypothetical protein